MFGCHVNRPAARHNARPPISNAIAEAAATAAAHGIQMRAAAIFVAGPRHHTVHLRSDEAARLREYSAQAGIRVVAHSAYVTSPVWSGSLKAGETARAEREACQRAGIQDLVVHLPAAPADTVLERLAAIAYTHDTPDVRIALETPAVVAGAHYNTPDKLRRLFVGIRERIDPALEHVSLCIDTAHLWTSGVDLATREDADVWLAAFERHADVIPPSAVLFHLNGSARPRGRGPDTHAPLAGATDLMWGPYRRDLRESGLAAFVDYAVRHDVPAILERAAADLANDYAVLHELAPSARAGAGAAADAGASADVDTDMDIDSGVDADG